MRARGKKSERDPMKGKGGGIIGREGTNPRYPLFTPEKIPREEREKEAVTGGLKN